MLGRFLPVALCLALGACAGGPPPDPASLKGPPAWAMEAAPAYPDVPACDGDPVCRARYYADLRARGGAVSDRLGALQRWARLVTQKHH